jgi:hypothetical protein
LPSLTGKTAGTVSTADNSCDALGALQNYHVKVWRKKLRLPNKGFHPFVVSFCDV